MADNKDILEARRWLRQRLGELGTQYPVLKEPESQERLRGELEHQEKEKTSCHESRQENHGGGH
jgi:hypothetical protein